MVDIKYSNLLNEVMIKSTVLGNSENNPFTAERFLYTILAIYDGSLVVDYMEEFENVKKILAGYNVNWDFISSDLYDYIFNESYKYTIKDKFYINLMIKTCADNLSSEQATELTCPALLECIFNQPAGIINQSITKQQEINSGSSIPKEENITDISYNEDNINCNCPEKETKEEHSNAKEKIVELTNTVKSIHRKLLNKVYGQDNAVSVFTSGYFQAELLSMTDEKRVRPCATYLFAGPPGVGKTFLAEKAAEALGLPFERFDMSEYGDKESAIEFSGSDKVYKNGNQGNFTSFVAEHPKCVVLFDEIEKAHISIIHLFLQMLDAGRIRDSHTDAEIPLKNVIMIFTTNAGKQLYENAEHGDFSSISRKVILKALQNDINPETGRPYFPAAICSRFASGNVVMFNHITAHDLYKIAREELHRHASNFENKFGVKVDIENTVPSAILFAEGGNADARTVRSRAENFFDDELFELFRLISGREQVNNGISGIEKISIDIDIPTKNTAIYKLFYYTEKPEILIFSSDEVAELCATNAPECNFLHALDIETANDYLRSHDIQMVLIDINYGQSEDCKKYLNIEDINSRARDFFKHIHLMNSDVPVYLIQTAKCTFDDEEKTSFKRQGVRDVLTLSEGENSFVTELNGICNSLHQQKSMSELAKANKLVTFETAQYLTDDGHIAKIKLFDFEMETAVDPEDTHDILSSLSKPNIKFDHIIGAEEVKTELKDFVEYLQNPKKYFGTGIKPPKGILLYGPPGTGKTMLAKAVACESDVTFITAEGNQFLKKYVGEGPEKVHELFRTARKYAPSILFIDEIDAIGAERQSGDFSKNYDGVLTALLTEMDGFKNDVSKPVFVIAATNYGIEPGNGKCLDPALVRRFDRRVCIELPNRNDRIQYIKMKVEMNKAFEITESMIRNIAVRSTGMSLAQLESVLEMALRSVVREGGMTVSNEVLEEAFETFNSGEKKNWDITQLKRNAIHEAGHTVLCKYGGSTPSYLTVVARGNHGGYMQHGDSEDKTVYTKPELISKIRTALGGRAAEIVYYGEKDGISTGASSDLVTATNIAYSIICAYGMDNDFGLAVINSNAMESGELSREVHNAVNKILKREMENAITVISANKNAIDELVKRLIVQTHMTENEIDDVFESCSFNDNCLIN